RRARQDPSALIRSVEREMSAVRTTVVQGTGYGMVRLGARSDDGGTVRGVYRAAGIASIDPHLLAALSLTNERHLTSTDPKAFPILEHYLVRWQTGSAEWELGKTSRR